MRATRRKLNLGLAAAPVAASWAASWAPTWAWAEQPPTDAILRRVDPELRPAAKRLMANPSRPWTRESLIAIRAAAPPPPADLPAPFPAVDRRVLPGVEGRPPVKIQVIGGEQPGQKRPAILHIHGGGYIVGRAQDATPNCQRLAQEFGALVVNVEYRLSPETAFPGPLDDIYDALTWLFRNAAALGVDPGRIAILGESAGGGLAAMLAIRARDRGEVPVCYQVLIYPMLDDRTGSVRHVAPFIGTIGWNEDGNRFGWSAFLGAPAGRPHPPQGAVPARVEHLAGLPPAFIGVGGVDLFVDEDLAYAGRLVDAGVPVQFHLTPGAFHGFDFVAPDARVSKEFTAAWKSALRATFETAARG